MNAKIYLSAMYIFLSLPVAAQTSGTFDMSHNVIASGGGSDASAGSFRVDGTVGQNVAGTNSTGGSFSLRGGFWAFQTMAPTAACVSVGGHIRTAGNKGIRNVRVTLTDGAGLTRTSLSSSFGYYRFEEIPVGQTYVLTLSSKSFVFDSNPRIFTLLDELTDVDFVAVVNQQ